MRTVLTALSLLLLLAACGGDDATNEVSTTPDVASQVPPTTQTTPYKVTVDHILIAVKNPRIPDGTTPEAAKELAYDLVKQLEAGADWAALKRKHSADPPPGGPYTMANDGMIPESGAYPRSGMAKAFGDVGFSLQVDETGIADFDATTSPFGYHIIKRLE